MNRRFMLALAVAALLSLPALAQIQPSRWGTIKSMTFGAVNRATLDNHFEIPIYTRATVGNAQLNLRLTYDSQFWTAPSTSGYWEPSPGFGWRLVKPYGSITADENEEDQYCGYWNDTTQQYDEWWNLITDTFDFTEPDGTVVYTGLPVSEYLAFGGGSFVRGDDYDCTPVDGGPAIKTIPDGKGYTIVLTGAGAPGATAAAFDTAGDQIDGGFTDLNGNTLTVSTGGGNTYFGDPLGTAVTQSGSGTAASPTVYSYTGPSGGSTQIVEHFENISLSPTSLGCGTHVNWSGTAVVPSEIDLPDGRKYTFGYDSNARLNSVTLPTGATINYGYTVDCTASGATDTGNQQLTRWDSVNGSAHGWVWNRSQQGGGAVQTIETDPYSNDTVFNFAAPQWQNESGALTEADFYSGSHSGGTEMLSATLTNTITSQYVSQQVTAIKAFGTTPLYRKTVVTPNAFGVPTLEQDFDWGTTSPSGGILRQVTTTYQIINSVTQLPLLVTVSDGATTASETGYTYDSYGNPLTVKDYLTASTGLTTTNTFNSGAGNGTLHSATMPNGGVTTYTYGACSSIFPTQVQVKTSATANLTTNGTWNCTGGVPLTATNANGGVKTYAYADAANTWQPSSIQEAANTTTIIYPTSASLQTAESVMNFNGTGSTSDVVAVVDVLGRPWLQQKRQAQGSTSFDTVETKYDYMDRPITVSVPYVAALGVGGGSTPVTTTTYDALSRVAAVTDGGGGQVQYTYSGNDVLQTVNAPAGENAKKKQSQFDGLGRLSSVCEVVTNTAAGTPTPGSGTCAQIYSQNGYWTKYTRNARGQITQVVQNAQSATTETRSFAFDWMGRMTSETNPENGTTSYVFDTDATCGTFQGDMVKRTDAAGNVTCYAYDLAHRVVATTYPSGPNAADTPEKHFVFDGATVNSTTMTNAGGRLAEAYTGPATGKITDLGFSYDSLGNTTGTWESTPSSGGYYTTAAAYYANRAVNTLSIPGAPAITYGLDGEGRTAAVNAASGQNPVTSSAYGVFGLTSLTLGSTDTDTFSYDGNTGRMAWYQFTVNGQADKGTLTWNQNGTLASLDIADAISTTADTQTCTYAHDDLARLWTVNCPSHWSQTFSLDAFGNSGKTATTGTSFSASFNVKNQIASVGGFSPNYDSNGDLLDDPSAAVRNVNSFDSEGRPTTFESVAVTFDALGRAVQAGSHEFVYGPGGTKLAVMTGGANVSASVPLPGGGEAVYSASTLQFYRHADNLGSSRLASTPARGVYSATAYAPEGEPYLETGTQDRSFTGQKQDIATGQYDFLLREYSPTQGRWWVPDPAGISAANPDQPQSWNRYEYALGETMQLTDNNGQWPTGIHNQIYDLALPGLDSSHMDALKAGSAYVDRLSNQGEAESNQHAMCIPGQTMGACDSEINNFIMSNIAQATHDGFNLLGMYDLGAAVHAFTDMESPYHSAADGTPRTWSLVSVHALDHVIGEDLIAGILNSEAFGQAIAQSVRNTRAAFQAAYPSEYKAATSGMINATAQAAWAGVFASTGSFPSSVITNEVYGCLLGNPAACPSSDDFIFMGIMGGDPEYLGFVVVGGRRLPVK